ncbi:VOC family protein [Alkalimonas sp.]|uniref:VOC family protein n=1 Tax=Alkalimonas sp. TaxID=1872453 RepID=UPI00263AF450|nr:VOC family protein [Alkalimonas sp.]MCC5827541.1 VOC family protein [Alkalimonas sp.]
MKQTGKINYIELPCRDMAATKAFFNQVFGWGFVDYGPEYMAFANAGIDGGYFQSEQKALTEYGSALVVLYSAELEQSLADVKGAGGHILKEIFSFPGGRRFHFTDPSGNEYAV